MARRRRFSSFRVFFFFVDWRWKRRPDFHESSTHTHRATLETATIASWETDLGMAKRRVRHHVGPTTTTTAAVAARRTKKNTRARLRFRSRFVVVPSVSTSFPALATSFAPRRHPTLIGSDRVDIQPLGNCSNERYRVFFPNPMDMWRNLLSNRLESLSRMQHDSFHIEKKTIQTQLDKQGDVTNWIRWNHIFHSCKRKNEEIMYFFQDDPIRMSIIPTNGS